MCVGGLHVCSGPLLTERGRGEDPVPNLSPVAGLSAVLSRGACKRAEHSRVVHIPSLGWPSPTSIINKKWGPSFPLPPSEQTLLAHIAAYPDIAYHRRNYPDDPSPLKAPPVEHTPRRAHTLSGHWGRGRPPCRAHPGWPFPARPRGGIVLERLFLPPAPAYVFRWLTSLSLFPHSAHDRRLSRRRHSPPHRRRRRRRKALWAPYVAHGSYLLPSFEQYVVGSATAKVHKRRGREGRGRALTW